jgi:exonuclease SbcD
LLLVGNHDLSPSMGRAHAIEEFSTLEVPHVRVLDRPAFLGPDELEGLPLQVIAMPWISRSGLLANLEMSAAKPDEVYAQIEERLTALVQEWIAGADTALPLVLTAHASVQGAVFGGERTVMLGSDLVLPGSLVKDPRLDYTALGHIHKPQNLNEQAHPPVIYPGSIERVDFGEIADERFFVVAHVARGHTEVEWRKLAGIRPFIDRHLLLKSDAEITDQLRNALPKVEQLEGAIVRLVLEYPREWEAQIDEAALREHAAGAFEFHLVKRPQMESRVRIPDGQNVGSLTPLELLDLYWRASHTDSAEEEALNSLAASVIEEAIHGADNK